MNAVSAPPERVRRCAARLLAAIVLALPLSGCSTWSDGPAYYWQSAAGHFAVMRQTRPIEAMLDDPSVDAALRERLRTVLAIRHFASDSLGLPDNGSYTGYAELDRPFVVWNVFATPELSMRLVQWCFPVAGCVSYRGYYDQQAAERFAARLRTEGYEAVVRGVPAGPLALEGIRVGLIESLCAAEGIAFERRRIHRDELGRADELMISSATQEILPVTLLDGKPVGNGIPGPLHRRLHQAYQRAKSDPAIAGWS